MNLQTIEQLTLELTGRAQDAYGDGQVETPAFFAASPPGPG